MNIFCDLSPFNVYRFVKGFVSNSICIIPYYQSGFLPNWILNCVDPVLFPILTAAVVRCSQSMTGLTWLPADEGFHVVRQSATADVFIQHLTQTEDVNEEMTENELAAFADWCKPTLSPQTEASTVEVTQVENLFSVTKGIE